MVWRGDYVHEEGSCGHLSEVSYLGRRLVGVEPYNGRGCKVCGHS